MTITVSTTDPRSLKALQILETADRWSPVYHPTTGEKFYRVPSQADPRVHYLTNCATCDCPDNRAERPCKHRIAVRLFVARHKALTTAGIGLVVQP